MDEHERLFLDLFSDQKNFPPETSYCQIIQTHISIVCVAPPYVYKVKKNIKLTFLDYSTKSKRKHNIEKEIILNKRLCKEIYLEVLPVYIIKNRLTLIKPGRIYDHILKMRYLPDAYGLANHLNDTPAINRLVEKLKAFYLSEKPIKDNFRSLKNLNRTILQNMAENIRDFKSDLPIPSLKVIYYYTNKFKKIKKNLFYRRYEEGHYRDCHGDLRIEHVYISPESVCIYDCIEFNDSFRKIDILCDLAFLGMELDFKGFSQIEKLIIHDLADFNSQSDCETLYIYYKIYRAMVRVKVNMLLSRESEINPEIRIDSVKKAHSLLSLALKYVITGGRPMAIVIMGKTATGKSTIADELSNLLGVSRYSTDEIRKKMAHIDIYEKTPDQLKSKVYSTDFSIKVYEEVIRLGLENLHTHQICIMDGTFSRRKYRDLAIHQFKNYDLVFIELTVSGSTSRSRLLDRETQKTVSDARADDQAMIDSLYEAPLELDHNNHFVFQNNKDINLIVSEILKKMADRRLT